jgi:hypothetical protein
MGRVKGEPEQKERAWVTEEVMHTIADHMAAGWSLRQVCALDGMPTHAAVIQAARKDPEGVGRLYREARENLFAYWAEEIIDIADDATNDWMEREHGPVTNTEAINRSRLRIDTRKWLLAKLKPSEYGDKTQVEHSGAVDVRALPPEQVRREIVIGLMQRGVSQPQIEAMGYEVPEDLADDQDSGRDDH